MLRQRIPLLLALLLNIVAFGASQDALYRINAGGGSYTDENGNEWEADTLNQYYNVGNSHSTANAISGTNDDPLYQTERWKAMTWTFPISNPGDYQVRLHFAETYVTTANSRVFDVKIQDDTVMENFDIYATVGPNVAYSQSFPVTVSGSSLTIDFIKRKQNPKICAIEILPAYSLYINAGGPQVQDSQGTTWLADTSFFGGTAFSLPGVQVDNTGDDVLYRTERYGEVYYEIEDVPNGEVEVELHWAEVYFTAPSSAGRRIFDVSIQGQTLLEDFDIFATVGPNTAHVETFAAEVTDGTLTIEFIKVKENPKINSLVVRAVGSGPTPTIPASTDPATTTTSTTDPVTTVPGQSQPSVGTALYRVNAGGNQFTDSEGNVWEADSYFESGRSFERPDIDIALTQDDKLFNSERWDPPSGQPMKYEFNVDNGSYEVQLGFAEVYGLVTGQRVFNVLVEDVTVLSNHDIYATVGANTADVETIVTEVTDGKLTILFEHVVENPKICNIAVFSTESSVPTTTTSSPPPNGSTALYRVNVGGPAFTDNDGKAWEADSFVTGGLTYGNNAASIDTSAQGTSDIQLYRTERYRSDMAYSFPVANGPYQVIFHYGEIYAGTAQPGQRVFDVKVEGTTVLDDYDIASSVGPYIATTESVSVDVDDGSLDITFAKEVENPKLNGIEILGYSEPTAPTPPASVVLYRVNAGGQQFVDSQGFTWLAGDGFVENGLPYGPVDTAIASTEDDELYQSEYYDPPSGQPMEFEFDVANGYYEVKLHFCEVYGLTTGQRIFNVLAEGEYALTNHDIYAAVGANTADVETFVSEVTDGKLTIEFEHVVENPKINAIEVYSTTAPAPTPPTPAPVLPPTAAPVQTSPPAPTSFESIYINAGGDAIYDTSSGITWEADNYYNTGTIGYKESQDISGTSFQELYRSERWDADEYPNLIYSIPVPDGVFEVKLHFADTFKGTHSVGARIFDIYVEGNLEVADLDIYATVGKNAAWIETITTACNDGFLEIEFKHKVENPTLSGIEINSVGVVKPHFAHAVPGGPYTVTDTNGSGSALVSVDGFFSHTHSAGAQLVSFEWKVDDSVVANTMQADFSLPVGEHTISLTVVDSTGDLASDSTTATVRPFGYPFIESLTPDSGEMFGGEVVRISGASFTPDSIVKFGAVVLSGPSEINIVDSNTIDVLAVPPASWGVVSVSVVTPVDESNLVDYEYLPLIPLNFKKGNVATGIFGPTTLAFGPDGNLYVGTQGGDIIKLVLDENYNMEDEVSTSVIPDSEPTSPFRSILGLAFDPMDTCEPPNGCRIYVAHSFLFHGDIINYNGKVSEVSGPNLDIVKDVVVNLPVSDHDHGINGLEFDDNGNMYIQVGGNTNAGVEGALSQTSLQKEDYLSAATLIARGAALPGFNGQIEYNADGDMTNGFDVDVFTPGLRNPFDLVFHSNGKLYGTDNGPNLNFGLQSTSCTDSGPEPTHKDKLVLLEEGTYHGHANRKRGETDSRQCIWRGIDETSEGYTGPIKKLESSTNGICEFQSDHFGGALRGQLILGRYKGELFHVKLTNEGEGAGVVDDFPSVLVDDGGLDVNQGPDGTLFVAQNFKGAVLYQAPDEEEAELLTVKSVFPRRGPEAGGTLLTIYGQKLFEEDDSDDDDGLSVTVGAKDCPVDSTNTYTDVNGRQAQWIKCTLPSGTGTADVVVSFDEESYMFASGYRYITGQPDPSSRRLLRKAAGL